MKIAITDNSHIGFSKDILAELQRSIIERSAPTWLTWPSDFSTNPLLRWKVVSSALLLGIAVNLRLPSAT